MAKKKATMGRRAKDAARLGGRVASLDQERLSALKKEYQSESDRGAALLAAAYVEGALEDALRRCLVRDELGDTLFDEANGPLGTLSAKLRMARALGVIPEVAYRDLELVRDIRNDFAHFPDRVSFDTPSVRDRCDATMWGIHVRTIEKESGAKCQDPDWSARDLYFSAIGMAVGLMKIETENRPRPKEYECYPTIPVPGIAPYPDHYPAITTAGRARKKKR